MDLWEEEVEIGTKAGSMRGFAVAPSDGTPVPAIIYYMDAPLALALPSPNVACPARSIGTQSV